jgi:intracellular septation protein
MTNPPATAPAPRKALNPWVKFTLELGPLALFFAANSKPGLFRWLVNGVLPASLPPDKVGMLTSTAVLMVAAIVTVGVSWTLTRRLAIIPVVTAVFVLVFGTLTLLFQDKTFLQAKLTIIYVLFGGALLGAMALGKLLLPIALDMAIHIDEAGWRKLTIRWGLFFFGLAAQRPDLGSMGGVQVFRCFAADSDFRNGADAVDLAPRDQERRLRRRNVDRRRGSGVASRLARRLFLLALAVLNALIWRTQTPPIVRYEAKGEATGADL